jgi:DNA-binding NarL/FixJ family response regulator
VTDSVDTGSAQIEIVLADDHAMIRSGLRRVLDSEPDLAVVAEAADVEAAIRETQTHQPDALVVDLNMPGAPTLPAIPRFLEASPGTAVIVLTMDGEPTHARRALGAGARGYVLKDAADTELVDSVRAVVNGRTYLDPNLGARLATMGGDPSARFAGISQGIQELAVGGDFAGHRIDKVIGRGGMGVVFRATDRMLDRTVALKLIAPEVASDPVFRARFERECRLAAAIDHPHAVQIFHAGEEDGLLYLTMRYVDGTNLRRLLRTEGRLAPARGVAISSQIASALDEAHALGLVHRDVKPENILVLERPPAEHAFLTETSCSIVPAISTSSGRTFTSHHRSCCRCVPTFRSRSGRRLTGHYLRIARTASSRPASLRVKPATRYRLDPTVELTGSCLGRWGMPAAA